MPKPTKFPAAVPFYVPTIDIEPYRKDPGSPEAENTTNEVKSACTSTGFFQITGHGISPDLQKSVLNAAAEFFALPDKEKKKLDAKTTVGYRGYDRPTSQPFEADISPDLEEVRDLGHVCSRICNAYSYER